MAIPLDTLRRARARYQGQRARTLQEAKALGIKSGFLCHSHKDADLVKGLIAHLRAAGLEIYVDWEDAEMPAQADRETAERIKRRIVASDFFLFFATGNSVTSRWCPWEIGYADGKKHIDTILVIPTSEGYTTHGNEYMQLYRRIDEMITGNIQLFETGGSSGRSLRWL